LRQQARSRRGASPLTGEPRCPLARSSAPVDATGRRTAAGIRGARFKLYPGAPHGLFVTDARTVAEDIAAFASG
jgi:pimeloyl-ACP methyl ester carboxylesterase